MYWFFALFVLLIGVGGWAVVAYGTYDREPTEELPNNAATTTPDAATTTVLVPVTMFDGSPAPEGIVQLVGENGENTYVFSKPPELEDVATEAVVPPVVIDLADDGTSFEITFGCAVSEEAVPAALQVFEDPFEVQIKAVVIGPRFGTPCSDDAVAGTFTIPLESPVGGRRVVVASSGATVEMSDIG